jgi:(p)ppGpp synthase/HD superfamily hydrolase
VASIVLDYGGSEDEAIAALLHDAVEDQGGEPTSQDIRKYFGQAVYEIVKGCTDTMVEPKPPWRARKEAYIDHVRRAPHSVKLVSAADKLHNARSILADLEHVGTELWERFTGGKDGSLWYYRALVEAFRFGESATSVARLVDELDRTVQEIERRAG